MPDAVVERLAVATPRTVCDEDFHRRVLLPHLFSRVAKTPEHFEMQIAQRQEASVKQLRLSGVLPTR